MLIFSIIKLFEISSRWDGCFFDNTP